MTSDSSQDTEVRSWNPISSYPELKEWIRLDSSRNLYTGKMPRWLAYFCNEETVRINKYLKLLRYTEYHINIAEQKNSILHKIAAAFYHLRLKRIEGRLFVHVNLNTVGPGLRIVHLCGGGGCIVNCNYAGRNLTVSAGVIVGNKWRNDHRPHIGDDVDISIGAKVIGKINIGNNVIVAPNSVVIKDVAPNSVVSGVPAKVIKCRENA